MKISESEFETMIFNDLITGGENLSMRGFTHPMLRDVKSGRFEKTGVPKMRWFRQVNIDPYGIIDIVGFYRHSGYLFVELMELKARPIESDDFDQIYRYKDGIWKMLNNTFPNRHDFDIQCILIGTAYKNGHFIQNQDDTLVVTCNFGISGLVFEEHDSHWHRNESSGYSVNTVKGLNKRTSFKKIEINQPLNEN